MAERIDPAEVAVIVAVRNEAANLEACVSSVIEAGRGKAHIIFVDDASTDASDEILCRFSVHIEVLRGDGLGPGRARNKALKLTNRRFVAFTDGDCEVAPDWLERLGDAMSGKGRHVSSVGGRQAVSGRAGSFERRFAAFLESLGFVSDYIHKGAGGRMVPHNPTCNVMYRREALEAAGGFDESLWPCEDLDLDLRLAKKGFKAFFTPDAVVEHRRPSDLRSALRMMYRYGSAHARLVKKHGFCQRLHALPLAAPIVGAAALLLLHFSWILASAAALAAVAAAIVWNGRTFPVFLGVIVPAWLAGFYSSIFKKRRMVGNKGRDDGDRS